MSSSQRDTSAKAKGEQSRRVGTALAVSQTKTLLLTEERGSGRSDQKRTATAIEVGDGRDWGALLDEGEMSLVEVRCV